MDFVNVQEEVKNDKRLNITTDIIMDVLNSEYANKSAYRIHNTYLFANWESDFLHVTNSGYLVETEVKQSIADFKADFEKREKHEILQYGWYIHNTYTSQKIYSEEGEEKERVRFNTDINEWEYRRYDWKRILHSSNQIPVSYRPNKFFYAVPYYLVDKILKSGLLPPYAGLIGIGRDRRVDDSAYNTWYDQRHFIKHKEAPFIHKTKLEYHKQFLHSISAKYNYQIQLSQLRKVYSLDKKDFDELVFRLHQELTNK